MSVRTAFALVAALLLASCGKPEPAAPALWEVTGPEGQHGYLFGTIHALPDGIDWRTERLQRAFSDSNALVVEVVAMEPAELFAKLATTPDQPPLSQRVDPRHRPALRRLLDHAGMKDADFSDTETWAAALTLSRAASPDGGSNSVDGALLDSAGGERLMWVIELEGFAAQLRMFDQLPEVEQRDLLEAVVDESQSAIEGDASLRRAWMNGDMEMLARETQKGILADPELRAVLFTARNKAWAKRVVGLMQEGKHPFVAVGAAHMTGAGGIPALLGSSGYQVKRIQ